MHLCASLRTPPLTHPLPTSKTSLHGIPDLVLLSSSGGLLGLDAAGCVGLALLDGALGLADGGGTGHGGGAEVTSVALGDGVGDGLVGPVVLVSGCVRVVWFGGGVGEYSLAVGLAAVDGALAGRGRALCVSGLLGDDGHTSLVALSGGDSDSLHCASV